MLSSVTIYAISENYLTAKEFDILALLITHPQRVFTYELIMELVWDEDAACYSRKAVSNHVSNLRKKLKITPDGLESVSYTHLDVYKRQD